MLIKKLIHYSLSISVLFFPLTNHPVLVKAEKLKSPDTTFRLFYELHKINPDADREQLKTLSDLFHATNCDQEKHHILIETPAHLTKEKNKLYSVTTDLAKQISTCRNCITEDIEIRTISNAFCYVFEKRNNPFFIEAEERFNAHDSWCTLGNITFSDLIEEYNLHRSQLLGNMKWCPPTIYSAITQKENTIKWLFKEFIERIEDGQIKPTDKILDTSRTFFLRNNSYRAALQMFVLNFSSHLFDIHIIRRLIEPRKTPHICIIAGYGHALSTKLLLTLMNAKPQKSYGIDLDPAPPIAQSLMPLSKEQLDIFN